MKGKKFKFLATILAATAIIVGNTVFVQATGSLNSISNGNGGIVSASVEGGTVRLSDKFNDPALQEEVDKINGMLDKSLAEALGMDSIKLYDETGKEISKQDISSFRFLTKVYNMELEMDKELSKSNPAKVKFVCNSMTSNMDVYVLHKCEEDGWELLNTSREDNMLTSSFHSASPAGLVYLEKSEAAAVSGGISPQTGESSGIPIAIGLLVIFGCIGVISYRKFRVCAAGPTDTDSSK